MIVTINHVKHIATITHPETCQFLSAFSFASCLSVLSSIEAKNIIVMIKRTITDENSIIIQSTCLYFSELSVSNCNPLIVDDFTEEFDFMTTNAKPSERSIQYYRLKSVVELIYSSRKLKQFVSN